MATKTIFNANLDQLFRQSAGQFFDAVRTLGGGQIVVALPGGRSVVGFLRGILENSAQLAASDWARLKFFIVDERLVPHDHADSNYKLLNELFFIPAAAGGLISSDQVHPFFPLSDRTDWGVSEYRKTLAANGGKFNIVVLGVGEDAHVAALFPQHHSLSNPSPDFITMSDSPKPPPGRMSASRALIENADVAFGLFVGEGKRDALKRFRDLQCSIQDCPAKILDSLPLAYVVTDLQ